MPWPWNVLHRPPAGANRLETPIPAIRPAFAANPGRPARWEPGLTTAGLSLFQEQSDSQRGMFPSEPRLESVNRSLPIETRSLAGDCRAFNATTATESN